MDETSQQSDSHPKLNTWLTVAATYLGTLVLIAYPLGFTTFWVQVWREYTHDAATALYAASLMPGPVVVAKSFTVFASALFTIGPVSTAAVHNVTVFRFRAMMPKELEEEISEVRSLRFLYLSKKGRVVYLFVSLSIAATIPYMLWLVSLDSSADVFYYVCAMLVAGGGTFVGTYLLFESLAGVPDRSRIYGQAIPLIASSALVASLFLVPLSPSNLPKVQFSEGTVEEAALISHSEGYWYVVNTPKTNILALPDSGVGTATIEESSLSAP